MFDHIGIVVKDLRLARPFYSGCLAPLGFDLLEDNAVSDTEGWLVYGTDATSPFFVVACGAPTFWSATASAGAAPIHIAFAAANPEDVDAFHQHGLAAGGRDNGIPGPRPSTTAYYAAYLFDPDGNNIEAGYRG